MKRSSKKKILIVEPQSSGLALIDAAIALDLDPIVISADEGERQVPLDYKKKIHSLLVVDTNNPNAVLDQLDIFCESSKISGVVCGFEYYVPLTSQIAQRLRLPGIPVSAAISVRYKDIMRKALGAAGIARPDFHVLKSDEDLEVCLESVDYPVVVKPTNMSGSIQVVKVSCAEELVRAVDQIWNSTLVDMGLTPERSVLVEEYIPGPEFSVEGYVDTNSSEIIILSITKKFLGLEPHFVEMGHMVNAPLDAHHRELIEDYIKSIVKVLGINMGPFHGELRLDEVCKQPILMEIGARLAGDHLCELIEMATGVDLAKVTIQTAIGESVELGETKDHSAGIVFCTNQLGAAGSCETLTRLNELSGFQRYEVTSEASIFPSDDCAKDFSARTGFAIFKRESPEELARVLESARRIWMNDVTPKKHILIINRWDDEFAAYHEQIDHSKFDVSYISTQAGVRCLSKDSASIETVDNITNFFDLEAATAKLVESVGPIDQVIAMSEFDLLNAANLRGRFEIPGPDLSTVSAWRDKTVMKELASKAGIPVPRWCEPKSSREAKSFAAKVGWPVVIKPKAGAASEGVHVVSNSEELGQVWMQISDNIDQIEMEEFVVGEIFHSDGLVKDGEVIFEQSSKYFNTCFEFSKGEPLGSIFVTDETFKSRCREFSAAIVSALSVENGAFHIEFFKRPNGELVFLEMGARVGGGEIPFVIRDVLGVDLIGSWLKILVGESPAFGSSSFTDPVGGFLMIPEPTDGEYEVVGTNSVAGSVPQVYKEILPANGTVLDGKGGYEKISGRFHLKGHSESEVFGAITDILNKYVIQTITIK